MKFIHHSPPEADGASHIFRDSKEKICLCSKGRVNVSIVFPGG